LNPCWSSQCLIFSPEFCQGSRIWTSFWLRGLPERSAEEMTRFCLQFSINFEGFNQTVRCLIVSIVKVTIKITNLLDNKWNNILLSKIVERQNVKNKIVYVNLNWPVLCNTRYLAITFITPVVGSYVIPMYILRDRKDWN
jgi:hypothetical protein